MGRITVADLEDDVVKVLKHRAELHGRSLSAEIRAVLGRETVRTESRPWSGWPRRANSWLRRPSQNQK